MASTRESQGKPEAQVQCKSEAEGTRETQAKGSPRATQGKLKRSPMYQWPWKAGKPKGSRKPKGCARKAQCKKEDQGKGIQEHKVSREALGARAAHKGNPKEGPGHKGSWRNPQGKPQRCPREPREPQGLSQVTGKGRIDAKHLSGEEGQSH